MIGILTMISFRTLGMSEKKKRAKNPAEAPNPARVRPTLVAVFGVHPAKFGWILYLGP